jgi:hypothetical protein
VQQELAALDVVIARAALMQQCSDEHSSGLYTVHINANSRLDQLCNDAVEYAK